MAATPTEGDTRSLPSQGVRLRNDFARALPELGAPSVAMRPDSPEPLVVNDALAAELGLDADWLRSGAGVRFMLGNDVPRGATPVSQVYAGHQFGTYNPRLGDGRALLLGEIEGRDGRLRDIHLKGSGPTPFTRSDGYAAVGPMLREYLMGEAMHALGVPTTRALAVVLTGQHVVRPESLDPLPGAVLVRTAASHLRVGTFQFVRSTGDVALLRRLADHAIARHYPALADSTTPYLGLFAAVIEAQARLIAQWMLNGFVHGVMNTDNMTISGETIDYGPCAFLDAYDPAAVFSSIDEAGRYAYGRQPSIAQWNLARFGESLLPLLGDGDAAADDDADEAGDEARIELAREALARFGSICDDAWLAGMRVKLGLGALPSERLSDERLVELTSALLGELHRYRIDYTRFFRTLVEAARGDHAPLRNLFAGTIEAPEPGEWFGEWLALSPNAGAMHLANPVYIPRNHHVDAALDAASGGDLEPFMQYVELLRRPFDQRVGFEEYELPPPGASGRFVTYCGT